MRSPAALAVLAASLVAAPRPARANMAKAVLEGERFGAIVPEKATAVRVDRETLAFALTRDLGSSAVTAVYRMTNTGAAAEGADVAFAFVRGDRDGDDDARRTAIEADGAPLRFRAVTDGGLLGPRLRAWLEAHPEVDRELAALEDGADLAPLRRLVEAAGGRCHDDCRDLLAWYHDDGRDDDHRLPQQLMDDSIVNAAREAIPGALGEVATGWSTLAGARLGFLLFHLDFLPEQTRTVTVHYEHHPTVDRSAHANAVHRFDYLLSPAKRWAGFGPLDISVRVPDRTRFTSPLPFRREGDTWRAQLPGLPDGELRFETMSLDGLWFGMTEPGGYWAILVTAMAAAAIGIGGAAGRLWAGASTWKRVLVPLVTAGPLAAVCNLAVLVLLLVAFPTHALGFGYGGLVGGALLVALSVPAGAAASAVSAARRARKARLAASQA